jgi:hypothetical protein
MQSYECSDKQANLMKGPEHERSLQVGMETNLITKGGLLMSSCSKKQLLTQRW